MSTFGSGAPFSSVGKAAYFSSLVALCILSKSLTSSEYSAAVQPLFGQLCNLFGRRWTMLFVTALFTLGCGICGGATSGTMLIIGRSVQGAGSGGVVMIVHIILADMVPLRVRGYYLAIILTFYGLGLTLGPFIGGVFTDRATWRWVSLSFLETP